MKIRGRVVKLAAVICISILVTSFIGSVPVQAGSIIKGYANGVLSSDPYTFDFSKAPKNQTYWVGDFYCRGTTLLLYRGKEQDIIIPEGITNIGEESRQCSVFDSIELHSCKMASTVKEISSYEFCKQKKLKTITLNEGLERIDFMAFYGCKSLESVVIPSTVKFIDNYCFENCLKLKDVNIKTRDVKLEMGVFDNTQFLKNLIPKDNVIIYQDILLDATKVTKEMYKIPEHVISIAGGAFLKNMDIVEVDMSDKVLYIGEDAFHGALNLEKIRLSENLKEISNGAFSDTSLEEITLPKSLEKIGGRAFDDCSILSTINFKTKTTDFVCGIFGSFTYTDWMQKQIAEFQMPIVNGVLIDGSTAKGDIVIPDTVTYIGEDAFEKNENITSVYIPDSVKEIRDRAFSRCLNLKNVVIGDNVKLIGPNAFSECSSLEKIILPDSVETLEYGAFCECSALKEVRLSNNIIEGNALVFDSTGIDKLVIPYKLIVYTDVYDGFCDYSEDLKKIYLCSKEGEFRDSFYSYYGNVIDIIVPDEDEYIWLYSYQNECKFHPETPVYHNNYNEITLFSSGSGKQLTLEDQFQRVVDHSLITWKSSNTSVVTVSNGKITPVGEGNAEVISEYNGNTYTTMVTVKAPYISESKVSIKCTDSTFLYVWGAKTSNIKWSTSNKAIATVSVNGKVTAKKKGKAVITATIEGKKYTCKVTVK